ncbi:hypothetical protein FGO68_gene14074 [Halteria grandinella]|uniref:Uncharacterized protein n=1 Tax=Halteria grandinella TaxID=5974 RepID=A0A8J8NQM8_HALGN|nr:hypothetical protein FGO68_gene14074 [Halteria grandinella]
MTVFNSLLAIKSAEFKHFCSTNNPKNQSLYINTEKLLVFSTKLFGEEKGKIHQIQARYMIEADAIRDKVNLFKQSAEDMLQIGYCERTLRAHKRKLEASMNQNALVDGVKLEDADSSERYKRRKVANNSGLSQVKDENGSENKEQEQSGNDEDGRTRMRPVLRPQRTHWKQRIGYQSPKFYTQVKIQDDLCTNIDLLRPPSNEECRDGGETQLKKKANFKQSMSLEDCDDLLLKMLQHPLDYVKSVYSYLYVRTLNYEFILLKNKSLQQQPSTYFDTPKEEEESVTQDERLVPARNERGRYPEFYYKMTPNFYEYYDLSRYQINNKQMLLYWLKYYSAKHGFQLQLHQENFRKSGQRVLRYYCEYKKKLLPDSPEGNRGIASYDARSVMADAAENGDEYEIQRGGPVITQNCNFRLLYRCEVDQNGNDCGPYYLQNFYPYHNHELKM